MLVKQVDGLSVSLTLDGDNKQADPTPGQRSQLAQRRN